MKDREFLIWIHARLCDYHCEDELADYMHKLRAIIRVTPKDRITPNTDSCNSLESLLKSIANNE